MGSAFSTSHESKTISSATHVYSSTGVIASQEGGGEGGAAMKIPTVAGKSWAEKISGCHLPDVLVVLVVRNTLL